MSITAKAFFHPARKPTSTDVEDCFFSDLRTRNSTFKRTASDRFHDLDARCLESFELSGATIGQVLDIGISSGATTLALYERLLACGHMPAVVGTDIAIDGRLVKAYPGVRVLTDEAGHPLQYDVLGRVVRPWGRRADYATGMLAVRALANAWLGGRAQRLVQQGGGDITPVRLISPRVKAASNVQIEKNDIFVDTPAFRHRFDFIRACNILNRGYFDEEALRRAMANIVRYLTGPGAFLLIARSARGCHVGTLFQVSANGRFLDVVDRFCGGSEVEWLMLETPLPEQWAI